MADEDDDNGEELEEAAADKDQRARSTVGGPAVIKGAPATPATDGSAAAKALWTPILAVLGGVVGSAAWVSLVGGVVLAARFERVGVPPGPTVSLIPTEQQAVVGLRFVAIPVLLALMLFLILLATRDPTTNEGQNRPQSAPKGLIAILVVGALAGSFVGYQSVLEKLAPQLVVIGMPVLSAAVIYFAVKKANGFTQAGLILFVGVAVCAGVVAAAYELGRPPTLDIASVVRSDGSGVGGFYVAKSDSNVYLITPTRAGGPTKGKGATQPLPVNAERCDLDGIVGRLNGKSNCYINELVVIPAGQVAKLLIGPRGVRVNAKGFRAARRLTEAARFRADEQPAKKPKQARKTRKK